MVRLEGAQLLRSVQAVRPFDEQLVKEVVANNLEKFGDILNESYGSVTVKGMAVSFSPALINNLLG